MGSFMLYGPVRAQDMSHLRVTRVQDLGGFEHVYKSQTSKVDIAETCGGEGRSFSIAARRHTRAGPNFDLVVGVDLTRRENQTRVL
eukprot:5417087-Alexandrium_andersonii.AAC.1